MDYICWSRIYLLQPKQNEFELFQNTRRLSIQIFVELCLGKDMVSFFSYHLQEKAKLVKLQLAEKTRQLVQPAATHSASFINCQRRLKESESILHRIVSARDFVVGTL